ncbi:MAG: hypothetical protein M0R73_02950 [Dehalococcoidia bacterium]|nr:hypothetical protein [Dehalococcoidia bacterium]
MLRVILVTAPVDTPPLAALVEHLRRTPLSAVSAPPGHIEVAEAIARPHALHAERDARLESVAGAIALLEAAARTSEGRVALVVGEDEARGVVTHALEAPVAAGRLAFDPGGFAEIEVRADAPWTVNHLNDRCYAEPEAVRGIVRT